MKEETKIKISKSLTGHKRSKSEREAIRKRMIGNKIWEGRHHSKKTKKKLSIIATKLRGGENSKFWKGDSVGYWGVHKWVYKVKGKATNCFICNSTGGKTKGCHWANLDGKYKRKKQDYVSFCSKCHYAWDNGKLPINIYEWI